MAIKDIKPSQYGNYSHILGDKYKNYTLTVEGCRGVVTARLCFKDFNAGKASCFVIHQRAEMDLSYLNEKHLGKGLGLIMYEALFAHLYHQCNVSVISGGRHSTSAARIHKKLAKKHGLAYPYCNEATFGGHPYDGRFESYIYTLR